LAAAATRGAACLALAQLPSRSDEELSGAEEGQPEELRELLLRSREILERIEQRFFAAHSLAIGAEDPPPAASVSDV
jgi:hypothetical protein